MTTICVRTASWALRVRARRRADGERRLERVTTWTRSGVSARAGNDETRMGIVTGLRRLYSTFAGSWPGTGLLLLRLVVGSVLVMSAGGRVWGDAPLHATLTSASLGVSGLLLIAGLWTPVAGAATAVVEIARVLTMDPDPLVGLMSGTVGGALVMLGPGRWSVDARLFGWKRIEAPPGGRRPNGIGP